MNEIKTLLSFENKNETKQILSVLDAMDENSKYSLLNFLQGAKFMQNIVNSRFTEQKYSMKPKSSL